MSTNIKIIHAHDFIRATPEGQLDLEKCKISLAEILSASAPATDYEIILDTRKAQVELSIADLWYLAEELSKLGKPFFRKTAIVCPLEGFDNAGFLALCAQNRGVQVKAFTSFDDAIEWLFEKNN
ncbi:MAG: hypothetical protein WCE68_06980 [Anaerolineales bacterium]